jgi:hypothetical protein
VTNKITLEITERTPFAEGHEFGAVGAYERLRGWAHHAVDPKAPAQALITDIDKAPVNAEGLVEFLAEFYMVRPVDAAKGNKRLFYDYGNRGNIRAFQFFNDAPHSNDPQSLKEAGNGYLMRRGYSFVWSAWEGDLLPGDGRVTMKLPVASNGDAPITGLVRQEFIPGVPTLCFALSGRAATRSHPTVSRDTAKAQLTKRRYAEDERIPISAGDWEFAQVVSGVGVSGEVTRGSSEMAVLPSDQFVYLHGGFQPGWIYELIYEGKDPLVMGLGHIAVRDLTAFLKYGEKDAAGNSNPLASSGAAIEKAYAWGRSQTGRCLRDFVYLGFNGDAEGRRVFDGVLPHVSGAGRMWLNQRFANAVSMAGQQYEDHYIYGDRFPFSYADCNEHMSGNTEAILKRPDTDPLVIHTQTSTEYWQRRGSLVHTDTKGNDLEQPEGVRVFLWASSQHNAPPIDSPPDKGVCQNYANIVTTSMIFRALLDAMDGWATDGVSPPDSRIPTRKEGTLVDYDEWRKMFPSIPGTMIPTGPASLKLLDYGPDEDKGILSKEPPEVVDAEGYTILIPACDEDGNDVPGIRAPMVQAPMGTYVGWNIRSRGHGHGATYEFQGSYIPFSDSPEERAFVSDPRPSVLERYGAPDEYVAAIVEACNRLVADRLMLAEDIPQAIATAGDWGRPRHVTGL